MELYLPPINAKLSIKSEFGDAVKMSEQYRKKCEQCDRMRQIRWSDPKQHEKPSFNSKPFNAYEAATGKYLGTWLGTFKCAVALGLAKDMKDARRRSSILRAIANKAKTQKTYKGYTFRWDTGDHSDIEPYVYNQSMSMRKPVVVTDPDGTEHTFGFTYEAAEYIGCTPSMVQHVCKGHCKRAKGYLCRWKNERDLTRGKRSQATKDKKRGQGGLRCALYIWDVLIGEYPSITQLAKENGLSYTNVQGWYHGRTNNKHIKIVKI